MLKTRVDLVPACVVICIGTYKAAFIQIREGRLICRPVPVPGRNRKQEAPASVALLPLLPLTREQLASRRCADWLHVIIFELDAGKRELIQHWCGDEGFVVHVVIAHVVVAVVCNRDASQGVGTFVNTARAGTKHITKVQRRGDHAHAKTQAIARARTPCSYQFLHAHDSLIVISVPSISAKTIDGLFPAAALRASNNANTIRRLMAMAVACICH